MYKNNIIVKKILVVCTTDSMICNFLIPHIKKWEKHGFKVDCACSETGFYFSELKNKYSLNMIKIPLQRSPYKFSNVTSLIKLHRLIKHEQYSLIVSQEPVGGAIGRLSSLFTNSKVIYTAHGFHFYKGSSIINWITFYPIERFLAHFTDILITSNHEDYVRSLKFKAKKKIMINGVGIDLSKYTNDFSLKDSKKKELGIPLDYKVVFIAAELIERKNYKTALLSFSKMNINKCYFVICGEGPQKEELIELTKQLQISEKVIFLGFRKDLCQLYKIADVFFFPSYQEGLSVALLAAMASGLPIVCSHIRGNVDCVVDELGGYMCNVEDFEGFANKIEKILLSSELAYQMGQYNAKCVKKYDINIIVEDMYKILLTLIDNSEKELEG